MNDPSPEEHVDPIERAAYLRCFDDFISESGWRSRTSPAQLIEQWRDFVETCVEGYSDSIYEDANALSVRALIERGLHDPGLSAFADLAHLRDAMLETDAVFRQACREGVLVGSEGAPWWQRCVPTRATGELAADLVDQYGLGAREAAAA